MDPVTTPAALIGPALISFLGGTAFRLLLSFLMDRLKDWQEYKFELGRIYIQDELEQKQHDRAMQAQRLQADLGVLTIESQREYDTSLLDMANFQAAHKEVTEPTGFPKIDALNSFVRPGLAIFCIFAWGCSLFSRHWVLSSWDLELISGCLGVFIGSRIHSTGK